MLVLISALLIVVCSWAQVTINYSSSSTTLSYYISYSSSQHYYRVYLCTNAGAAGYGVGGIAANYLVENANIYHYTGTGTSWSWSYVSGVTYSLSGTTAQFAIPRSLIGDSTGCASTFAVIGQVGDSPSTINSNTINQPLSQASTCSTRLWAIPTYFNPVASASQWSTLQGMSRTGITIINPDSGPDTQYHPSWNITLSTCHNKGIIVVGYVYTSNGARDPAAVRADINAYFSWYPVDGIFFDETWVGNCDLYNYYSALYQYVKSKSGKRIVIMNSGTSIPECYMQCSDIVLNAEMDWNTYLTWRPIGYESNYPMNRFWHCVYNVSDSMIWKFSSLSKSNHAGWAYATTEVMPNPYLYLPTNTYLNDQSYALMNA